MGIKLAKFCGTHLPEQATAATTSKIDVNIVVLATDGLFDEWLFQNFAIDDNSVAILTEEYLGGHTKAAEFHAEFVFHVPPELFVYSGSTIP